MATKIYLRATAETTLRSPAVDAAWTVTSDLARCVARTAKSSDAMTTVTCANSDNANQNILLRQYVRQLTAGQTVTGAQAMNFQCRASEVTSASNMFTMYGVRIIANDNTTVRKTVVALQIDGTEVVQTTLTNRNNAVNSAATNYTTVEGDVLVIEIGLSGDPTSSNNHASSLRLGDAAAADLAVDDASTTDNNPFVTFTDTLTFSDDVKWTPAEDGSGNWADAKVIGIAFPLISDSTLNQWSDSQAQTLWTVALQLSDSTLNQWANELRGELHTLGQWTDDKTVQLTSPPTTPIPEDLTDNTLANWAELLFFQLDLLLSDTLTFSDTMTGERRLVTKHWTDSFGLFIDSWQFSESITFSDSINAWRSWIFTQSLTMSDASTVLLDLYEPLTDNTLANWDDTGFSKTLNAVAPPIDLPLSDDLFTEVLIVIGND